MTEPVDSELTPAHQVSLSLQGLLSRFDLGISRNDPIFGVSTSISLGSASCSASPNPQFAPRHPSDPPIIGEEIHIADHSFVGVVGLTNNEEDEVEVVKTDEMLDLS